MQRNVTVFVLAVTVLLTVIVVPGCIGPGVQVTETFSQTVSVAPGTVIIVDNLNGNVVVETHEENTVVVNAEKRTKFGQSELDKAQIQVTGGNPLRIETTHTEPNVRVSVDYRILVPPATSLAEVLTSNGGVTFNGTAGNVRVVTSNGDIIGTSAGIANATTSNGRIELNGMSTPGSLLAVSSNGRIDLHDISGFVSAVTSNGAISVTNSTGVTELRTSNARISADIPAIRGDVKISSSNGGIDLRLATNLNADIIASTSNGRITTHDLPLVLRQSSPTAIAATIGSGGPTISITTSNADIDLYPL
jgi:DUF4097 and DUF4098 domain-containing protein YvlB